MTNANKEVKTSIIIPIYNSSKYLDGCIVSILNQSEKDYELIFINNGSTDNSREIIEKYSVNNKKILNLKKKIGNNCSNAINLGLAISEGKYLTWISSDDYYYDENSLAKMIKILDENSGVDLVSGRYKIFGIQDEVVGKTFGEITFEMMRQSNYIGGGFVFRKECFDKIGYMREDLIGVDDWDYWIRLSKYFKVLKIEDVVYCWRKHGENLSSNTLRMNEINENIRQVQTGKY